MEWKPLAQKVAHWTIPPGVQDILRSRLSRGEEPSGPDAETQAIVDRNAELMHRHKGQRCFVLATGPSIREQDLKPLRNEWCIAVSEFFRHEDYTVIEPAYYAFAPSNAQLPRSDGDMQRRVKRLAEMRERFRPEIVFFALTDRDVVMRSAFANDGDRVHYLDCRHEVTARRVDLTTRIPSPYGAAIMGTWIAIYMGFSEIYLVGCDHDHLWKWDGITPFTRENYYQHFYGGAPTTGYEPMDVDDQLKSTLRARHYYRLTNEMAREQGTRIFNANPRGYLNVVPRVSLAALFE